MTSEQQIKALAELDGWSEHETEEVQFCYPGGCTNVKVKRWFKDFVANPLMIGGVEQDYIPNYLTSYDAIIPLIQKQPWHIQQCVWEWICNLLKSQHTWNATPSQLCEALLRATGKWTE